MKRPLRFRRNPNLGATRHTMLGPGGRIVEPKSEGAEIARAINMLRQGRQDEAMHVLILLQQQVEDGYHRNPPRAKFDAGGAMFKMSDDVHELRYTHTDDGEDYKHPFEGEVEMWAVLAGGERRILLVHKQGKPLWEEF